MQYGIVYGIMVAFLQYLSTFSFENIHVFYYFKQYFGWLVNYSWLITDYFEYWSLIVIIVVSKILYNYIKQAYINYMSTRKAQYTFEFCSR